MSKIKVTNLKEKQELDIKRCYLPVIVETDCPKCKKKLVSDLRNEYLSYPVVNGETKMYFYCDECDEDVSEKVVLRVAIESA